MNGMMLLVIVAIVVVIAIALFLGYRFMTRGRPRVPEQLRAGSTLPEFDTVDEHGTAVGSASLRGTPAIILFVRGNWCPFCTKQVRNLAGHYKRINELGAKLIFITPKPLQTTRRVAEFFEIDFDFWLDEDLAVIKKMGLLLPDGVPAASRDEYGEDTVWPAALVVDAEGRIRYSALSKLIFDRPKPDKLVAALRKI